MRGLEEEIKWNDKGLVPVVAQDIDTGEVLMMAWMNMESLMLTLSTKRATYWSRSRKSLWVKGESSGHFQQVESVYLDCDGDTLLLKVKQTGVACHTGNYTCFYRKITDEGDVKDV